MRSKKRWIALAALPVLAALILPFVLQRGSRFYTDGARVREPAQAARETLRDVLWEPPRRLAEPIDLPDEDEYEPRVSPAGDPADFPARRPRRLPGAPALLVFTRGRPGENADLWTAERERGGWGDPVPLVEVNSPQDELGAAFSHDGEVLLFYSNRPGGQGGYDLWLSVRGERGWGEPRNAGPSVNGPFNETGPALSADGTVLWFSSDRGDLTGARSAWRGTLRETLRSADYDIFSARVKRWPLGPDVSGEAGAAAGDPAWEEVFADAAPVPGLNLEHWSEGSVAASPAGDFLYFASNRPGGQGGFDLYRARIREGLPELPQNLGPQVNAAGDELDPAPASGGFELYFARAGDAGKEDLFVTFSREVYLTRESGGPYLSLTEVIEFLRGKVPLALAFLASFVACLLFLWLLHRRVVTLNLIARCFVFALLIHLLLALWMNRTEVEPKLLEAVEGDQQSDEIGVALADAVEEGVGLAIRDALAETGGDVAPELTASERKPPAAPQGDALPAPAETWTPPRPAAGLPEAPPAPPEAPAALELAARAELSAVLPQAAPEPAWPVLEGQPVPEPPAPREIPKSSGALPVPEQRARPEAFADRLPAAATVDPFEAARAEGGGVPPPAPAKEVSKVEVEPAPPAPALPGRPEEMSEPELVGVVSLEAAKSEAERAGALPSERVVMETAGPARLAEKSADSGRAAAALPRPLEPERRGRGGEVVEVAGISRDTAISRDLVRPVPGPAAEARPLGQALPPRAPSDLPEPAAPSIRGSKSAPAGPPREGAGEAVAKVKKALPPLDRRREGAPAAAAPSGAPGGTGDALSGPPLAPFAAARPGTAGELGALPPGDLAGAIGRLSLPGAQAESPGSGLRSTDSGAGSYQPKLYELRKGSARKEAVRAGGGTEATERAVERGLAWLALHQSPDGRWSLRDYASHLPQPSMRDLEHPDWNGRGRNDSRGGGGNAREGDTAATGLALLAYLGHGDNHLEAGPYREAIARALAWLLNAQKQNGDLRGGGNLYMHAIASFALCEAHAYTRDPALGEPAQRAIDFTVRSQNPQRGGWRYQPYPQSNDVDTSVFGWMLMALKSGRAGGLRIDEQCLERAAGYLESARMPGEGGRYAYQPASRRTTLAMTAQGFFCQEMLGDTLPAWRNANGPTLRRAARDSAEHLLANLPRAADQDGVNYYYWYYATLALFQEGGEGWAVWNRTLSELLLKLQVAGEWGTAAGSWDPLDRRASQGGRIYSTAMAILSLEVYYRYTRVKGK